MKKGGLLVVALLVIGATGFVGFKFTEPSTSTYKIGYQVECSKCDVYYRTADGTSKIEENVSGWTHEFTANTGQFVYVSANNRNGSPVKVKILRNGQDWSAHASDRKNVSARTGRIL